MSDKIININQLFSSQSLITRQIARDLYGLIDQMPEDSIILDFSGIDFASRSFFDEFNSYETQLNLSGKKVRIINLNDNLAPLYKLVGENSKKRRSISYKSVANAKVISI
jgi:anti-anti-sigma regulatory factor